MADAERATLSSATMASLEDPELCLAASCTDLYIYCSALVSITGVHHCWQFPYSTLKKSHHICYSFHLIILQAISHIHSAYFMTSVLTWICKRSEVAMSKVVNIKQKGINMTNNGQKVPGIKAAISPISDLPHLIFRPWFYRHQYHCFHL